MKNKVIASLGAFILAAGLVALFIIGMPTANGKVMNFNVSETTLQATFYEVSNSGKAVLLCGGFSSDRQMLRPLANLFVQSGISAMTFDYSGHGSSGGTVGFDNATNGQIAKEIDIAIGELAHKTGIAQEDIILLGHSMGGRSILELYATQNRPLSKNIVLISPQINYDNNTQSTAFTGVNDADIAPWNSLDYTATENINVTLIGSYADDIVSANSMQEIYNRLSDNGNLDNVSLNMVNGVFHSYMVYSANVANAVFSQLDIAGARTYNLAVMYYSFFAAAIGLFMLLVVLNNKLGTKNLSANTNKIANTDATATENTATNESANTIQTIKLLNYKKFIIRKLLLFAPSLLIMAVIACVAVLMPFGAPIMSIAFIGGIAGYGILSLLAYRFNKMPGTQGQIKCSFAVKSKKHLAFAIAIAAVVLAILVFVLGSGLYNLFPLNMRLFWLFFAGLVMSIGFYIGDCEGDMLKAANAKPVQIILYNIVQYFLLFLMGIAYLVIGSYSGLIGLFQNLILMYICIFTGKAVGKLTNRLLGSLTSAFMFQATILTSTCLMVVF